MSAGGEAVSTADDAWQEWLRSTEPQTLRDVFMAGYRRALEDAELEIRDAKTLDLPTQASICAILRARAAGVGTKDGDDDE